MIVIVEGIDRVGKTTFIDKMCNERKMIRLKDRNVCSESYADSDFSSFSLGKLDTSVSFLEQLTEQGFDVIVDRLHLTELVYGKTKNRDVCQSKIYELDKILSTQECILVYVQPTDLKWSSEQAGEDETQLDRQFNFEYNLTNIESFYTNFNNLDETVYKVSQRIECENKKTVDAMMNDVRQQGEPVNDTVEVIGSSSVFLNITTDEIKNTFDIDVDLFNMFKYEVVNKIDTRHGAYVIKRYFRLFEALQKAMSVLETDNLFTRRCVIKFDNAHCFQNIQFMIRNHKLVVICNMRSCNMIDNYENDILICSLLADAFKEELRKYNNKYEIEQGSNIIMQIGSLHYFIKGDEKHAGK